MPKILGIDPGSICSGVGIVEISGKEVSHIYHGVIKPPRGLDFPGRIEYFHEHLSSVIGEIEPDVACVEKVFVSTNPSSALKLGLVRGAIILTLRLHGLEVIELSPREVKLSLTGYGNAEKSQVASMVQKSLGLKTTLKHDESDALAIAISCGFLLNSPIYMKGREV